MMNFVSIFLNSFSIVVLFMFSVSCDNNVITEDSQIINRLVNDSIERNCSSFSDLETFLEDSNSYVEYVIYGINDDVLQFKQREIKNTNFSYLHNVLSIYVNDTAFVFDGRIVNISEFKDHILENPIHRNVEVNFNYKGLNRCKVWENYFLAVDVLIDNMKRHNRNTEQNRCLILMFSDFYYDDEKVIKPPPSERSIITKSNLEKGMKA